MWGLFFLTVAVVAVSLLLPGYAMLRGFGVARCLSVSFAPLIGVGAYVLLGFAYEKAGVWSSWSTQAAALFVLAAVIFAVLRLRRGRSAARIPSACPITARSMGALASMLHALRHTCS